MMIFANFGSLGIFEQFFGSPKNLRAVFRKFFGSRYDFEEFWKSLRSNFNLEKFGHFWVEI